MVANMKYKQQTLDAIDNLIELYQKGMKKRECPLCNIYLTEYDCDGCFYSTIKSDYDEYLPCHFSKSFTN